MKSMDIAKQYVLWETDLSRLKKNQTAKWIISCGKTFVSLQYNKERQKRPIHIILDVSIYKHYAYLYVS